MLGRQFCSLESSELVSLLAEFGLEHDEGVLEAVKAYGEPFLRFLGAEELQSIDASSYQGASLLHDMNLPIPAEITGRFGVVAEGDTLEHVFKFPVAVANSMELLAPGGSYIGIGPANNFRGHGFYQFSPDLFFRIFAPENGFKVERMILCGVRADADWFEVQDPLAVGQFVESMGGENPTYLLVYSKKPENPAIFREFPVQSVYKLLWNGEFPGEDHNKLVVRSSRT
jgi:hypothetical protein